MNFVEFIYKLFNWLIYPVIWIFDVKKSVDISEFDLDELILYLNQNYKPGLNDSYLITTKIWRKVISVGINIDFNNTRLIYKGDSRVIDNLLNKLRNYTEDISYYENSFNNKLIVSYKSLRLMKDKSISAFIKASGYISPVDSNVLESKINRPGYWLLQGPPGTGKTSFINLLISIKCTKEKIDGIFVVNKPTNLVDLLKQFQEKQKSGKWVLICDEFDRHLKEDFLESKEDVKKSNNKITQDPTLKNKIRQMISDDKNLTNEDKKFMLAEFDLKTDNNIPTNIDHILGSILNTNINPLSRDSYSKMPFASLLANIHNLSQHYNSLKIKNEQLEKKLESLIVKDVNTTHTLNNIFEQIHMLNISNMSNNLSIYLTTNSMLPEESLTNKAALRDDRINTFYIDSFSREELVNAIYRDFELPFFLYFYNRRINELVDLMISTKFNVPVKYKKLKEEFTYLNISSMIRFIKEDIRCSTLNRTKQNTVVSNNSEPNELPDFSGINKESTDIASQLVKTITAPKYEKESSNDYSLGNLFS